MPLVDLSHDAARAILTADGFRFTAVPPRIAGAGTFTVRAFASCP